MVTEKTLTDIRTALQDEAFKKLVEAAKDVNEVIALLGNYKDEKNGINGIIVSAEDIDDINVAVEELKDEDLNVSGGGKKDGGEKDGGWWDSTKQVASDFHTGAGDAFGHGKADGDFGKTMKFQNGVVRGIGGYAGMAGAAAGVLALVYATVDIGTKVYKKIEAKRASQQ